VIFLNSAYEENGWLVEKYIGAFATFK